MSRWEYNLKSGIDLRNAVHSEDYIQIIESLRKCYQELLDQEIIDEYEYDSYTDDFELYGDFSDDTDPESTIDYELSEFYDLCDNLRVWIPLE